MVRVPCAGSRTLIFNFLTHVSHITCTFKDTYTFKATISSTLEIINFPSSTREEEDIRWKKWNFPPSLPQKRDINDTLRVGKCSYGSQKFLTERQVAAGL